VQCVSASAYQYKQHLEVEIVNGYLVHNWWMCTFKY